MYMGVPTTLPVKVVLSLDAIFATPKSISLGTITAAPAIPAAAPTAVRPGSTGDLARKMFSGLMSLCTMPARCATASAPRIGTRISIASTGEMRCSRSSLSRSVSPSSSSCTM